MSVKRSLEDRTGELGEQSGETSLDPAPIEGAVAEVTGNVGMTLTTDVRFEMLRIDVGGRMPCSVEDLESGKAIRKLHDLLRREFAAQHKRGVDGL